jgi:predicted small lipoprotein YifL
MRRFIFLPTLFTVSLLVATLAGCGKKPDGTPYGVDPAKLPAGRQAKKTAATYKQDMPKGAELNAATNSARAGQPTTTAALAPAAR